MDLRPATLSDVADFSRIFLDCWHNSYAGRLPDTLVSSMTPERSDALWEEALAGSQNHYLTAVAADKSLLGFVGFRLENPVLGYVSSLYVSPRAQGTGSGRALLEESENALKSMGATEAFLWVFAENKPSRAFYEKRGWAWDGAVETLSEWGEPQIRMSKVLL